MDGLRTFIVSSFAALVGSIGSVHVLPFLGLPQWLWVICGIGGGLIGNFAYNPKKSAAAFRSALWAVYGWRPRPGYWKLVGLAIADFYLLMLQFLPAGIALAYIKDELKHAATMEVLLAAGVMSAFALCAMSLLLLGHDDNKMRKVQRSHRMLVARCNPFCRRFWLYRFAYFLLAVVVVTVYNLFLFVRHVFVFVHSEGAMTCSVGGFLGIAAGTMMGSVLVGAAVGGVVGFTSREIIGKRLLHLQVK